MTAAVYGMFLSLVLVMRLAPQSPLGEWLLQHLVREPLAKVSSLERHQLIYCGIVLVMLLAASETLAIYGTFEWAIISAFDLAIYLDGVAVTVVLASTARVRTMVRMLRTRLFGRRPRIRSRRPRCPSKHRIGTKTANDDDPAPARYAA
jgi:hypothetical protein